MSYVEKIYNLGAKAKNIFSGKMFKFFFFFFSTTILAFGVLNVYAQDEDYKISPAWEGTKAFYNEASETNSEEDNMTSHAGQLTLNTAWVVASTLAPNLTSGADGISANSNIPGDLKYGLIGFTDQAWAYVYENQPSVDLIAHLGNEWVPGYEESTTGLYAAEEGTTTSGYDSLIDSGVAPLWSKFRDMAYVFLVIVMIVIGFMIMFRSKIGGQLMVSVGNTIPSVIVSLVLITFSFAIAGIIIDVGGIIISLLYSIFEKQSISIQDFGALFAVMFKGVSIQDYFDVVATDFTNATTGFFSNMGLGLLKVIGASLKTLSLGVVGLLLFIIGLGVVCVGAIKLLIVLYKSYFELLLNVVLGPVKILLGTMPGNEAMKINWFTGLLRNVLVFPIVYFIVNIPVFLASTLGEESVVLSFPEKLTGASLGDTGMTISTSTGYIGLLINFVLRVFVLYYAAQAPKFAEAIIPVKETNRAAADAMAGAKMSLSKAPLVGGLFK